MSLIKKISYHPWVVKLVSKLHARTLLRKMYFYLARPKDDILSIQCLDFEAKFLALNPDDLRLVESVTGSAGERRVIESFLSLISLGETVFDIGANIGTYAILLAKRVGQKGKVIAFEPEEKSLALLEKNIALNQLENIQVVAKALGDKAVTTSLYLGKTTGNFSLVKSYEDHIASQKIEVVAGDEFVLENKITIPSAIKIDVEGFEYQVLYGLKNTLENTLCRVLCVEMHPGLFPAGVDEKKIISFIKSLGFLNVEVFKRGFSAYHIIATK